jgi:hypothetical protein
VAPSSWSGDVTRYSWNGQAATSTTVGTASILLANSTHGTLSYTVGGASGVETIERYVFGTGLTVPSLSGQWYLPGESGWGIDFDTQGDTHLTFLLVYAGGSPRWVYGTAVGAGPQLSFTLSNVTGTNLCPGCTGPTSTSVSPGGSMTLGLSQLSSGHATTTINAAFWQRSGIDLVRLF